MDSGARYHLEWESLLGWYRECSLLPSDHDLDITIWASDWTPKLQAELKAAAKRTWCPEIKEHFRRLKHPKYPYLVTPIQTIFTCVGTPHLQVKESMRFDMVDIVFMHRSAGREYMETKWGHHIENDSKQSRTELVEAVKAEPLSKASDRTWWVSNNDVAEHWTYAPYTLAPARVFGELSYVPANTASRLKSVYGEWTTPHQYAAYSRQAHPNTVRGKPQLNDTEFWDEWWQLDDDGQLTVRAEVAVKSRQTTADGRIR